MSLKRKMCNSGCGGSYPLNSWLRKEPALGIELEYENVALQSNCRPSFWHFESDGSLRNNGLEIVSHALRFTDVERALDEVEQIVISSGAEATERCGLHVHLNMLPFTTGQVWSLLAMYALLEPTIYRAYAVGRENNTFAVPLWANQQNVSACYRDINHLRISNDHRPLEIIHTCKYSALNLACLNNFGTIEMRQPYCTTDFAAIRSWVDFCMRLVMLSVESSDPHGVLREYEEQGLEFFQQAYFGEMYSINPDLQEMAEDAAYWIGGYAEPRWQDLDWNNLTEVA